MDLLVILSLVAAFGFGLWIGRPQRFDQSPEEIEERLSKDGEHATVDRRETVISILQKRAEKGSDRRRTRPRKPFRL